MGLMCAYILLKREKSSKMNVMAVTTLNFLFMHRYSEVIFIKQFAALICVFLKIKATGYLKISVCFFFIHVSNHIYIVFSF